MTDPDVPEPPPPARPARLPRERELPRARVRGKGGGAPPPTGSRRGLTRPMKAVLIGTGVVGVLSLALIECSDRGKPTKARVHWNAPPPTPETGREAALDDLIAQATARAAKVLPEGRLARLSARQVDERGMVHLDYGSASFEFEAPGASPCSVHLVTSWQGWAQRPGGTCHEPPRPPTCPVSTVLGGAFANQADGALSYVDYASGAWSVRFRDVPGARPHQVPDDCGP